ncbi:N,N-dimethylformamidase beta subunit family domain-containing protein [Uniformispora flossi]|uniref:N,N-dimethylformamidase beta subunit family domain-containing protein n=1 Tax=Uniformispora flossi TaxID=3390723 RepID=UPI003C2F556A
MIGGGIAAGAAGAAGGAAAYREHAINDKQKKARPKNASGKGPAPNPRPAKAIVDENARPGTQEWKHGKLGKASNDTERQCQGYASATTVAPGGSLDLYVTVNPAQKFTVSVYRLGHYGGDGARFMFRSDPIQGITQSDLKIADDPDSKAVYFQWQKSWELKIPKDWMSGAYLAVVRNERGFQNYVSFVVADHRPADFLCILPFATYQAYNLYPMDGVAGQSVYFGYNAEKKLDGALKRTQVSFARPFSGGGTTKLIDYEHQFIKFAERLGYDVTYACSFDLHNGKVDPTKYKVIVVPGHDEYWSQKMRDVLDDAKAKGVHIASFGANQCYWRVRLEPEPGVGDMRLTVYKEKPDPRAKAPGGPAKLWRDVGNPEQMLWGSSYGQMGYGVPAEGFPLVVKNADHWLWAGTGVKEGQELDGAVRGEADHQVAGLALPQSTEMTVLSQSTFTNTGGLHDRQEAVVYRAPAGNWVFNAGTFGWGIFLGWDTAAAKHIQAATQNLFGKMLAG